VIYILFVLAGSIAAAFAGFFFKKTAASDSLISIITNSFLYFGGFLYLLSAVSTIIALRHLPYSQVMPLGGITYIFTMAISYTFLKENITIKKITGVICIIVGAIIINI
jgi:drug/metabolite transporter (DMT)-like permease